MSDLTGNINALNPWDPESSVGDPDDGVWDGWLSKLTKDFDAGVQDLKTELDAKLKALQQDPANASLLAEYQAKLSEYTLYRSAQSKTIEALASMDKATVNRLA